MGLEEASVAAIVQAREVGVCDSFAWEGGFFGAGGDSGGIRAVLGLW